MWTLPGACPGASDTPSGLPGLVPASSPDPPLEVWFPSVDSLCSKGDLSNALGSLSLEGLSIPQLHFLASAGLVGSPGSSGYLFGAKMEGTAMQSGHGARQILHRGRWHLILPARALGEHRSLKSTPREAGSQQTLRRASRPEGQVFYTTPVPVPASTAGCV